MRRGNTNAAWKKVAWYLVCSYYAVWVLKAIAGTMRRLRAPLESFFATLKKELIQLIHQRNYASREEARLEVFEFIEVYYNRQRRHSTLGYLSPTEFEQKQVPQPSVMALAA